MPKGAEPPQDGRDQPSHQRAVAIGKTFQAGMSRGAVELLIERAMLVQDAIENIGRDPPRREAWRFSWQSESLRGHGVSVPIPKFVSLRGPSFTNFGIDRTLAYLSISCGFGPKVRMTNLRHQ